MFIRMKESKGFTLVELMIVVAIIGILAAVAVPYYQKYITKSRLTSMVWPGVHAIQTNVASYYSLNNVFPTGNTFTTLTADANTTYFKAALAGANTPGFTVTLKNGNATSPLFALGTATLSASPTTKNGTIGYWTYSGGIATQLGLAGAQ
ncbi:MAG TPA: prepilin-type N-terminal cleavage/methylation domain-containing protein [Syntrophobacteraceae bacterium]|nr:prepilin-type N-terminal cleavage/methylation domain-containing protein [Syntrophobacteraceae bacterium]